MKLTYIVESILSTDVQHRVCEVVESHLQAVIRGPEGGAVAVADTLEATARRGVRLKHHEWLSRGRRQVR